MANNDATNIKLGVCSVSFGGVDLGFTLGGVEVEVSTNTHETKVDQFGESVVNEYIIGRMCTAKVPLAETTIDNLVAIMPGATKIVDGVDAAKIKVEVTTAVGTSLRDSAAKLVLHPKGVAGVEEDFVIPLANAAGALSFAYKVNEERVYTADFKAYPENLTGLLFVYGDETAVA